MLFRTVIKAETSVVSLKSSAGAFKPGTALTTSYSFAAAPITASSEAVMDNGSMTDVRCFQSFSPQVENKTQIYCKQSCRYAVLRYVRELFQDIKHVKEDEQEDEIKIGENTKLYTVSINAAHTSSR